jgi:cell division protein FtsB
MGGGPPRLVGPRRPVLSRTVRVVSLRRRLLLVSLVYLVIVLAGGAMVLRISTQRDDVVTQQRALVADAPLDGAQQAELRSTQSRLEDLRIQLNATIAIVLGFAFATTLAAALLVRRWVTRPVERLARGSGTRARERSASSRLRDHPRSRTSLATSTLCVCR